MVSPGAVAFRRDMFLRIPLFADVKTLADLRQMQVDRRLMKVNAKRVQHDYAVGERVLVRKSYRVGNKLRPRAEGPFQILRVHTNGTITILRPRGIHERINIRRMKPYREPRPVSTEGGE